MVVLHLKKSRDFQNAKEQGLAFVRPSFILQKATPKFPFLTADAARVGFTASRRVGNAVKRNRAKRIMRHLMRECQNEMSPGFDYVMVARERILHQSFSEIKYDLQRAFKYLTPRSNPHPETFEEAPTF